MHPSPKKKTAIHLPKFMYISLPSQRPPRPTAIDCLCSCLFYRRKQHEDKTARPFHRCSPGSCRASHRLGSATAQQQPSVSVAVVRSCLESHFLCSTSEGMSDVWHIAQRRGKFRTGPLKGFIAELNNWLAGRWHKENIKEIESVRIACIWCWLAWQ